ncbi:hypothetical protein ColLi_11787 [Colletotrichum liriopes]|uniref:Uncharacterized protein n=1 Tax=Colletotrichum liriopes TaxID=708192 RepID=A0AA37GX47_9PEZI|nr:hypothetical protein ColLi_11787 [Colletotrichum liriopes]
MSRGPAYDAEVNICKILDPQDNSGSPEEERGRVRLRADNVLALAQHQRHQRQVPAASSAASFGRLSPVTGRDRALGAVDSIHRSRSRSASASLPIPIPGAVNSRRLTFHRAERAAAEDDSGNDSGDGSPGGRLP